MLFSEPSHQTDVNCEDMSSPENPRVFFDISINGCPAAERVVIELFANVVPITAENFRVLCTGEKSTPEKPLHYKGTAFDFIQKDFYAQGGDISKERGGESIYGGHFKDENHELLHSEPGMLSMCGFGPNANGSSFFITFRPFRGFDRIHVVFGKIIDGMGTLYKINQIGTRTGRPSGVVEITDCGEIKNNVKESHEGTQRKSPHFDLSNIDSLISRDAKEIASLKKELWGMRAQQSKEVEEVMNVAKKSAAMTVLQARIEMAEQAAGESFDVTTWDLQGWRKALADLGGGTSGNMDTKIFK